MQEWVFKQNNKKKKKILAEVGDVWGGLLERNQNLKYFKKNVHVFKYIRFMVYIISIL